MIKIGNKFIGDNQKVYVVAEIGINHNGDMKLAKEMISAAKLSGADAVKFQNYFVEDFIIDRSIKYTYKSRGENITESQFDMFKRYELSFEQLKELKSFSDDIKIDFFSTPTSKMGIEHLKKLGVKILKNGSDFLQNLELIYAMAETGLPIILSTGMASLAQIDDAVRCFESAGGRDLVILHCISQYPTPKEFVNLKKINSLKSAFQYPVGFSDHTSGIVASIGAVTLGACFIEKHFTLSQDLPGPDHRFSSDPKEFKDLVNGIRYIESALGESKLGSGINEKLSSESFTLSCVAKSSFKKGEILSDPDIIFSRPGNGFPPKLKSFLVGKKLTRDKLQGSKFEFDDFI